MAETSPGDKRDGERTRTYPLAQYHGDRPPRPQWFETFLGDEPELGETECRGATIAWQRWGDPSRPGVVLVHGGVAHKKWWDFIGPALARHHAVTALDLSGMGDSDWREEYPLSTYAEEVMAVAEASGLNGGPRKPLVIGHSFGGFVTMETARKFGGGLAGAVVLDAPIRPPEEQRSSAPQRRGGRVYESMEDALSRFRLLPDQDCDNPFLVDHIARNSLKRAKQDGQVGWRWKFDPDLWPKMKYDNVPPAKFLAEIGCPMAFMRGEISALVTGEVWRYMTKIAPQGTPIVSIPEARHHLMLDQPLALIAALRTLLSAWPHETS